MQNKTAVLFEDVTLGYGSKTVISNLNCRFEKGKSYSIIGTSGCGKTTLLHSAMGLVKPLSGEIRLWDQNPAIVLQEYGLFPWKTVWENMVLGLVIKRQLTPENRMDAYRISESLGLTDHHDKYPHQLSGGQKQRVALARAWLLKPELMLMDEPFSALDAMTRETLQNDVMSLMQARPSTWITVTHSIEEAVFLGSEIWVMSGEGGRITMQLPNPTFGYPNARETGEFYKLCIALRKVFREVSK